MKYWRGNCKYRAFDVAVKHWLEGVVSTFFDSTF